jgi:EAL domain-containing protein (putative c-di-GMP-specific phosphodiesterase class I)
MERVRYLQDRIKAVSKETGFEVWFQPINCLSTGAFCSMEALVRLREPDGSMISPCEFIPVAEQSGYISAITWFVVEEVCNVLRRNRELDKVSVSINISMPQLLEKGFIARLNSLVDQAGIARRRICLEFTERAIPENLERVSHIMTELSQEGYRCFLDDFGTGYSNFNFLLQMPFEIAKMDSCLLHSSPEHDRYLLSRTLTELFHKMNFTVVAEGVETMEEVHSLKELGVDRIQGFALARPMPEDKLISFYRQHPVTQ